MGWASPQGATLGLGVLMLAIMGVALVVRARSAVGSGQGGSRQLTLYETALLAGGSRRVSDTALSYLTWSGVLEVRESTERLARIVTKATTPDLHPVEQAVLAAVDASGVRAAAAMAAGRRAARQHVTALDGLVVAPRPRALADGGVLLGTALVVFATVWWTARQEVSAGFLPLVAVVAVLFAAWWFGGGRPRLTRAGVALLEEMRGRLDPDLQIAAIGVTSLPLEKAMTVIALYGRDALTGELSGLHKVITGNPAPSVLMAGSSLGLTRR